MKLHQTSTQAIVADIIDRTPQALSSLIHCCSFAWYQSESCARPIRADGVQEAPDGTLSLPRVATQADIVKCMASTGRKKAGLLAGICIVQSKKVNLWDLHNVIEKMGGFTEVSGKASWLRFSTI